MKMLHFTNHIKEHMTKHPVLTSRTTSVEEALALMKKKGFRHLPIVENGKVVGIVSDRSLKEAGFYSDTMRLTVGDVMILDPYCVDIRTPFSEVIQNMIERKIGSAIVLNLDHEVVGIFTSYDAMKILASVVEHKFEDKSFEPDMEQFISGNLFI